MWGLRGLWRERGKDERRLVEQACGFRSQRQKERGHVEDSQHGRWGSRANDLSGTGSILFLHNLRESHMTSSMPGVDEVVTQTFQAFDFINVIKHMHTFYSFVFPIFF